jgi:hypothetical protein
MRSFKLVLATIAASLAVLGAPAAASAADVYSGYDKVGSVSPSSGGRYDIKQDYTRVGYVKAAYGGRWDVYEGYTKVGYVKGGPPAVAAGAALLLL